MRGSGRRGRRASSVREAPSRRPPREGRPPARSSRGAPPRTPAAARAPWPAAQRAMSKVRVSSGSPTLERMEGRPADAPKSSACRCLFGPVDRPELAREWLEQSRHLEEAGRRRWNFDFCRGEPLEGRFEWRALDPAALPDFYSRPPRLGAARPEADGRERRPGASGACSPPRGLRRAQAQAPPEPRQEGPARARSAGLRKRPATDDSSPESKRANTSEEIPEDPSEDPPLASPEEQTPKKKRAGPKRCQT